MGTRRENLDEAIAGLKAGIAGFADPDEPAVARACAALRGRLLMRRLPRINQAYFLGLEAMTGRPAGDELARIAAIAKVTAADVARVRRAYLADGPLLVTVE